MRPTNTRSWYRHSGPSPVHVINAAVHTIIVLEASPPKGILYILHRSRHISCLVQSWLEQQKKEEKSRTVSVSSILRSHFPACLRANNWLINAVRNPPRCSGPVGEGANLSSGVPIQNRSTKLKS